MGSGGGGLKGPAHTDRIRAYVKPDNVLRQLRELRRLVPAFEQVQLIRVWSGIEGYTRTAAGDGPSARVPGLHYAFGSARALRSARGWRDDGRADRHGADFDADREFLDRSLRGRAGEAGGLSLASSPFGRGWG